MMNVYSNIKILFFGLLVSMLIPQIPAQAEQQQLKQVNLVDDWGIEPVHLRISAAGFMIEFRYKVLDPEKALVLSDRKDFPTMISMKSKARLSVPFGSTVGYLKSNRKFLKKGKNYITMFSNENRHMLPGDQVRIQVRDQLTPPLVIDG
jgi:hypothetical protein